MWVNKEGKAKKIIRTGDKDTGIRCASYVQKGGEVNREKADEI